MRTTAIVLATVALAGCTIFDSGDTRLIRHRPLDGHPAALLSGVLRADGPCLVVERGPGDAIVVVWPPQYRLGWDGDRLAVVDWLGRSRWTVGQMGEIGGGELTSEAIQGYLLTPIPQECTGRPYYWLAGP